MKTVHFLTAALLSSTLLISGLQASEKSKSVGSSVQSDEVNVKEQIFSAVKNVYFEDTDSVFVHFNVSEQKEFQLIGVRGSNSHLVDNVKYAIESRKFRIPAQLSGQYTIKVRFTNNN